MAAIRRPGCFRQRIEQQAFFLEYSEKTIPANPHAGLFELRLQHHMELLAAETRLHGPLRLHQLLNQIRVHPPGVPRLMALVVVLPTHPNLAAKLRDAHFKVHLSPRVFRTSDSVSAFFFLKSSRSVSIRSQAISRKACSRHRVPVSVCGRP